MKVNTQHKQVWSQFLVQYTPVVEKVPVEPSTLVNAERERNGLKRRPVAFTVDR